MQNYNPIYRKFIDDRNAISANKMTRGNFYLIKEYTYADGDSAKFADTIAPIIYTLYVSPAKNIVHAVKVSGVNPNVIKKFFGKFINEDTEKLQMRGSAKDVYAKIVSKVTVVRDDAYRTYNISGIKKVVKLSMDVNELTPKNKNVTGIDTKSQRKNV